MRSVLLAITVIGILGLLAFSSPGCVQTNSIKDQAMAESGLDVSVMTNKVNYASGEPIAITLKVFNHAGEKGHLPFQQCSEIRFYNRR